MKIKRKIEKEITYEDFCVKIREVKALLEDIYECGKNNEEVNLDISTALIFTIFLRSAVGVFDKGSENLKKSKEEKNNGNSS